MEFLVIGISGKAQAGKGESLNAIKRIVKKYYPDFDVINRPFAAKLKEIAKDLYGWDGDKKFHYIEHKYGDGFDETNEAWTIQDLGRQLLINIGNGNRNIRSTVWADYVQKGILEDIKLGFAHKKIYVIDDMRFKNEMDVMASFGNKFLTVRIQRDVELKLDNISEIDLDGYDGWNDVVDNNGSLEDLEDKWKTFLETHIERACARIH